MYVILRDMHANGLRLNAIDRFFYDYATNLFQTHMLIVSHTSHSQQQQQQKEQQIGNDVGGGRSLSLGNFVASNNKQTNKLNKHKIEGNRKSEKQTRNLQWHALLLVFNKTKDTVKFGHKYSKNQIARQHMQADDAEGKSWIDTCVYYTTYGQAHIQLLAIKIQVVRTFHVTFQFHVNFCARTESVIRGCCVFSYLGAFKFGLFSYSIVVVVVSVGVL